MSGVKNRIHKKSEIDIFVASLSCVDLSNLNKTRRITRECFMKFIFKIHQQNQNANAQNENEVLYGSIDWFNDFS